MLTVGISSFKGDKQRAHSMLFQIAHQEFSLPGEKSFPLASYVSAPQSKAEEGRDLLCMKRPSGLTDRCSDSERQEFSYAFIVRQVIIKHPPQDLLELAWRVNLYMQFKLFNANGNVQCDMYVHTYSLATRV